MTVPVPHSRDAVGEIHGAAVLHLAQGLEHLHRGDAVDGQRPEVGEDVGLQAPLGVAGMGGDPAGLLAVEPFQGLLLEGVGGVDLLLLAAVLAFGTGVDALQELASRFGRCLDIPRAALFLCP